MYIICIHNIQVVLGYCCIGSLNVVSKFKLVSIDVLASDYSVLGLWGGGVGGGGGVSIYTKSICPDLKDSFS